MLVNVYNYCYTKKTEHTISTTHDSALLKSYLHFLL
jgi:hypothetical protein